MQNIRENMRHPFIKKELIQRQGVKRGSYPNLLYVLYSGAIFVFHFYLDVSYIITPPVFALGDQR